MSQEKPFARPFTGKHMTAILVAGFGVVFAVNFTMATLASTTFGGVVVENSYVASQEFNGWLKQAAQSRALGWQVTARHLADGRVELHTTGAPATATIVGDARHPLGRLPDATLEFRAEAPGVYVSRQTLPDSRWDLRLTIQANGRTWRGDQAIG